MKIHLIAIGGAVMHNLALDLHRAGHEVTGSDDEIYDPAKSRLQQAGILPPEGWDANRIHSNIDVIILGMHAKKDNPELTRAQELGLKIVSFPEYIGLAAQNKKRIVVGGSHGKTTTTSMIMHALKKKGISFDYMVGANLEGFDRMVQLTDNNLIILEGDEYLSSCLDPQPKFNHYHPHILVLTGIAWDHINVFPTPEEYEAQFKNLVQSIPQESVIVYYQGDPRLRAIAPLAPGRGIPYKSLAFESKDSRVQVFYAGEKYSISVFGQHNLENMRAAQLVCQELGMPAQDFLETMKDFKGAGKRLQAMFSSKLGRSYRDYAHAPSKLKSTVRAVREQYPDASIWAVYELHTYSSLRKDFLPQYENGLIDADHAIVFYAEKTLKIKDMEPLTNKDIRKGFAHPELVVASSKEELSEALDRWQPIPDNQNILLWLSSGHFDGLDLASATQSFFER